MKALHPISQITLFILVGIILITGACVPEDTTDLNPTDKFVGTWNVSDQAVRLNYQVTISASPYNTAEVLMSNFADLGATATALVVGNTLVIEQQTLAGDYVVEGNGSWISDSKLTMSFTLDDGIDSETRNAIFSR